MRFLLVINLGEDAMKRNGDIANALHAVANELETAYPLESLGGPITGSVMFQTIRDDNGNTVGQWAIKPKQELLRKGERCNIITCAHCGADVADDSVCQCHFK